MIRPLVALGMLCWSMTATGQVPFEPPAFTALVAEAFAERSSARVLVVKPLMLRVELGGRVAVADLEALQRSCVDAGWACRDRIRGYVESTLSYLAGTSSGPDMRQQLHVSIRNTAFVQQLTARHQQHGIGPPVLRHYLGDLWMVLVFDAKSVFLTSSREAVEALGLTEVHAFDVALKNTRASNRRISHARRPFGQTPFSYLRETLYESSRLLTHADWAAVAKESDGDLIVAVPAVNLVIFGVIRNNKELQELEKIAASESISAAQPVTAELFRWHADGWEVITAGRTSPEASAVPRPFLNAVEATSVLP